MTIGPDGCFFAALRVRRDIRTTDLNGARVAIEVAIDDRFVPPAAAASMRRRVDPTIDRSDGRTPIEQIALPFRQNGLTGNAPALPTRTQTSGRPARSLDPEATAPCSPRS